MINLDYGIIGNCTSAALISNTGSMDWLCLPIFDSASVFAKILDEKQGGNFEFVPSGDYKITQRYLPKTNILSTKFTNGTIHLRYLISCPAITFTTAGNKFIRHPISFDT
jgi:alpha,alpha-trehalase